MQTNRKGNNYKEGKNKNTEIFDVTKNDTLLKKIKIFL